MSSPTSSHEYWRELTALASTGELTDQEIHDLASHLDSCPECCRLLREYELATFATPFLPLEPGLEESELLSGSQAGFQREARRRVITRLQEAGAIRQETNIRSMPAPAAGPPPASSRFRGAWAAIACALTLAASTAVWKWEQARHRAEQAESRSAALAAELNQTAHRLSAAESDRSAMLDQLDRKGRAAFLAEQRGAQTSSALTDLADRHQSDLADIQDMKEKLNGMGAELEAARAEVRLLSAQKQDAEAKLQESAKSSSMQLADQLKKTSQLEARIQDLTRRSQDQQTAIQRQEKLLSTDRDIRDLMGARNLHIIDAADNTGGRQEPWFGRVFYTEGKSLVFYAFDLDQPRNDSKNLRRAAAFQVWGEKQGVKAKARSLGIFFLDQKTQDRWILKFEDPEVLAQIDRVYITVEPPGGSTSPHGKELLATNLAIPANHP